jgi:hypothetical protein
MTEWKPTLAKRIHGRRVQNLVRRAKEWDVGRRCQALAHIATRSRSTLLYSASPEKIPPFDREPLLKVNCIPDLLLYRQAAKNQNSRTAFLKHALDRLEAGDRSYTLARDGVLLHCAWLGAAQPTAARLLPADVPCPPNAYVLYGDYTHPDAGIPDLCDLSIAQRLRAAADLPNVDAILVAARSGTAPSGRLIEHAGLQAVGRYPS